MKNWILAGTIGIVGLAGVGNAFAAPATTAAKPVTITVTIDKNFGAEVTGPKGCKTSYGEELTFPISVRAEDYNDQLASILQSAPLCGTDSKATTVTVVLKEADSNYPFAVLPREYQWSGIGPLWIDLAIAKLDGGASCIGTERGQTSSDSTKDCKLVRNGRGLAFELTKAFDNGEIVAQYGTKKIRIPVYPCQFDVSGPLPGIVAGASEQILYLTPSEKTPNCWLPKRAATLNDEAGTRVALAQVEDFGPEGQTIRLTNIQSDLSEAVRTFKLSVAGGLVADVRAHVIPAIAVNKLVVKYNVPPERDTYGHFAAASGDAATDKDGNRFAVVSSAKLLVEGVKKDAVVNTSHLSWSSSLISSTASIEKRQEYGKAVDKLKAQRDEIEAEKKALEVIRNPPAGITKDAPFKLDNEQREKSAKIFALEMQLRKDARSELSYFVWKASPDNTTIRLTGVINGEFTGDLHQIEFAIDSATSIAPTAILDLYQTIKPATQEKEDLVPRLVLKLRVPLAAQARVESIPLPARDLLEVVCNDEKVGFWNSEIHAIRETAVTEGECRVQLKPEDVSVAQKDKEKWKKLRNLLRLYGPQTFTVVVRRGGVESKQLWQFSPTELDEVATTDTNKEEKTDKKPVRQPFWARSISLEEPRSDSKSDAYYTVEVRPIANQNVAIAYRNSTLQKIDQETLTAAGELTFTTRLRSRGAFAIPSCDRLKCTQPERPEDGVYKKPFSVRTYLSASVIATGLRFPAAHDDIKSSTANTSVQYVTPLVGALWSWERWDYDRGTNPWPLNPVVQAGGHFYKTGNGDISFNPLVGIAMTLPLVHEETPVGSQLGTKATLGAFFEWDTRDSTGHALVALSVNVGSLLSGK